MAKIELDKYGNLGGQNTFQGGLTADLADIAVPASTYTDALNMEFVTVDGDQYILQNIRGNKNSFSLGQDIDKWRFIPLGTAVFNNVAYIISGSFNYKGEFGRGTIGTYPSPDWDRINAGEKDVPMEDVYRPLHNFDADNSNTYTDPFVSTKFEFDINRHIDIQCTGSYDGSVNIIFTDDKNDIRTINSRFILSDSGMASLADRVGSEDSNTYSDAVWLRTVLLDDSSAIITVNGPLIADTGNLFGGGYRIYFKYSTHEGNFSDIIYESPFIPIARGNIGVSGDERTAKEIKFLLSDLNISYKGIKVYFEHHTGSAGVEISTYEINELYNINSDDRTCAIAISGYEASSPVDPSAINTSISSIDYAKSIAIVNNRLIIANTKTINDTSDLDMLKSAAGSVTLKARYKVLDKDYGDPYTVMKHLGYWPKETYEFGVVFLMRSGGVSPVFPTAGFFDDGTTKHVNTLGAVRADSTESMYKRHIFYYEDEAGKPQKTTKLTMNPLHFVADTSLLNTESISEIAYGFFMVRRERLKNVLAQGVLIPVTELPTYNRGAGVTDDGYLFYAESRGRRYVTGVTESIEQLTDKPDVIRVQSSSTTLGMNNMMSLEYLDSSDKPFFPAVKYIPQPTQLMEAVDPWGTLLTSGAIYPGMLGDELIDINDCDPVCQAYDCEKGCYPALGPDVNDPDYDAYNACVVKCITDNYYCTERDDGVWREKLLDDPDCARKRALTARTDREIVNEFTRDPFGPQENAAFYSGDIELNSPHIAEALRAGVGSVQIFKSSDRVLGPNTLKTNGQSIGSVVRDVIPASASDAEIIAREIRDDAYSQCRSCYWYSLAQCWGDREKCRDKANAVYNRDKNKSGSTIETVSILIEPITEATTATESEMYDDVDLLFIPNGIDIKASKQFTARAYKELSYAKLSSGMDKNDLRDYYYPDFKTDSFCYATASKKTTSSSNGSASSFSYVSGATIIQKYSKYVGVKLKDISRSGTSGINFNYKDSVFNKDNELIRFSGVFENEAMYCNVGNIANIYSTKSGEWNLNAFTSIFSSRGNKAYFAVSERVPLNTKKLELYRGDGYIHKIYKRTTYKDGVGVPGASEGDAAAYGRGIRFEKSISESGIKDIKAVEQDDEGKALHDLGIIVGMVSMTVTNTALRSFERISAEDTATHGSDLKYYPASSAELLRGDDRPDSAAYNHGYTGHMGVVPYFAVEKSVPAVVSEYPNRIIASPQNITQKFFNSFKDLKGFNYRDYGVDVGPINKVVGLKGLLFLVHYGGLLAVGVDERTLMGEGSEVYVDSAQALSPKAMYISSEFGTQNPESVVSTQETIYGVDYNKTTIWVFVGKDLKNISEFTVKTMLLSFKEKITALGGTPRVYSTFNRVKHNIVFTFMSESDKGKQTQVGSLVYSVLLEKWVTRLSDGNKYLMDINSKVHTFSNHYPDDAWEEDALVDEDGNIVRCKIRGEKYAHEFEIVVNTMPHLEKILHSIKMVSNKSIPDTIIYTTSGEVSDAAISIFADSSEEKVLVQTVYTRGINKTSGVSRLSIIRENAYYKNSTLNISVSIGDVHSKLSGKRVRDKAIKIKFKYSGTDETFVQAILTTLSKSYG
ncbi:MAG: hypothetical protein KAH32_03805 [Chlamydiia bacterium]|nr:hypothetical protein [Chlamydiia bacterium]